MSVTDMQGALNNSLSIAGVENLCIKSFQFSHIRYVLC